MMYVVCGCLYLLKLFTFKIKDTKDKIVSPVIPQPGAWKPRTQHRPSQDKKKKQQQTMPNFREKDARYQYGNYNRSLNVYMSLMLLFL